MYRCVAKNCNGQAEAEFTLNVIEKEKFEPETNKIKFYLLQIKLNKIASVQICTESDN